MKTIKLKTLSDEDVRILREVVERTRNTPINPASRPPTDRSWSEAQDWQSPEFYVAKTGGIPKREGNVPGVGRANPFKLQDGKLVRLGFPLLVFNISKKKVKPGFIEVRRDKYGNWLVWCCCAHKKKQQ